MKTSWQTKKLGEICNFQRGLTYSKKDEVHFSKNVVLRATNIDLNTNALDFSELKYIDDGFIIPKNKKVSKESLIICTASGSKSHLGKVALIDHNYNYAFGGFMAQITPKEGVDSKYLFYIFISDAYKNLIDSISNGVNINNLKFSDLENFEINLPSLSEQKRNVKILDESFEKLGKVKLNTENNLNNSKELFKSYLQNIFSNRDNNWKEVKIGEVCDLKSGTTIPKSLEKQEGDVLYVKVGDMNFPGNEVEIISSSRFVNLMDLNKNQIIPVGSVIFPKRGGAIFTNKRRKIIKPTIVDLNTMALVPSKLLIPDFLYYWFLRIDLTDLNNGSSIPQINNYSFDNILISFPVSIAEQKSIVKKLYQLSEQTKKLESIYKSKLSAIEELKKSILHKAFTGQL